MAVPSSPGLRPSAKSPRPAFACALWLAALAAFLGAVSGCDQRVGANAAQAYLLDRLDADMAEAKKAKDAGENVSFPCHAILATIPSFKNAGEQTRQKLDDARATCHDGALAFAKAQVAKLEAARKVREDLVEECFDLDHALDILQALGQNDPAVPALATKNKQLCP
jgi:hypothetical protein